VQVQQALTNLVMNAIQAVPRGGQVAIEVTRAHVAEGGEFACLRVRDDGPGISAEDRERIFEPFFTTKDVGEGTGLGLAVAIGLVRENGGVIQVTDRAGGGTVFSILLPLADVPQRSIA
jgi:signal transduction histidine kinase